MSINSRASVRSIEKEIAVCLPYRTPFAQIGKGLASYDSHELGFAVAKKILDSVDGTELDGVLVGEGFPQQPNAARVISNLLHLPFSTPALTLSNNCVSSLEAVAEAVRRIELGEGSCYLCIGEESLTGMPFIISGARQNKKLSTLEKLKKNLSSSLPESVRVRDTLEEGLGDGKTSFGMHVTAELVAQKLKIERQISDQFAYQSYKRASDATNQGLYAPYLIPLPPVSKNSMKEGNGKTLAEDEAIQLRKGLVENPERMGKAMLLFDNPQFSFADFIEKYRPENHHEATVSIFSACPRSDGASGALITTVDFAKRFGLPISCIIKGYAFRGVDPNFMGLGQAAASLHLLEETGQNIKNIDYIDIHEAFAATAIGALMEMSRKTGFDWESRFHNRQINAYGGSIALGHPFGATGLRLIGNADLRFQQEPKDKQILITACAHGGIAGAMLLHRPEETNGSS